MLARATGSQRAPFCRRHLPTPCCQTLRPTRPASRPPKAASAHEGAPPAAVPAAILAAMLLLNPLQPEPAHAAAPSTLGGLLENDFSFVDANKDGIISLDEFRTVSSQVAEEQAFTAPNDDVLQFSMKLFDLNGDGKLTPPELYTSFALDAAVSDDQIDSGAVKVFDADNSKSVTLPEFKRGMGIDLGPNGEQLQEWVFRRVDSLQDGNQKLDLATELGDALTLMRANLLGY